MDVEVDMEDEVIFGTRGEVRLYRLQNMGIMKDNLRDVMNGYFERGCPSEEWNLG